MDLSSSMAAALEFCLLKYVLQILWAVSNNEAKYEALLHGLRLAISLGIKRLLVYGDSLLVV
jgi:ribonuclease HI